MVNSCQLDITWPYLEPLYLALGQPAPAEAGQSRLDAGLYFKALAQGCVQSRSFAVDMGLGARAADYLVLGQLLQSCNRLEQALAALLRYQWLVARLGEARLQLEGELALLCWQPWPGVPDLAVERNMAGWLGYARFLLGPGYQPLSLDLGHRAPGAEAMLSQRLGCPVRFGAAHNALVFPRSWLDLPLRGDEGLHQHLTQYAEGHLRRLAPDSRSQALAAMDSLVGLKLVTLEAVADALALSPRQLQRQLAREGFCFRELLDSWRAGQLAALAEKDWGWSEIAAALGYAEQGALIKACRRWYGCTPGELKKKKGP